MADKEKAAPKLPKGYDSKFEHPDGTPTTKEERNYFDEHGTFTVAEEKE